ncbi:MAG: aminotransferase class V-fold PLP-dependent enzyme [Nitriliruptoraceae bacterium]
MSLYLDHAATTPLRPEARRALESWRDAANASAAHADGRHARTAVEQAREQVAAAIGCTPHEIVFTSGGTEADNLAVKGVVWAAAGRGVVPHVVTTAVEHAAVIEPLRWLASRGEIALTVVEAASDGRVDPERLVDAVRPDTVLVAVMAANNEIGAINDVASIATALADHPCVVHTDAVQMVATRNLDVATLGIDTMALSAHKFGGPQGVGVAYLRRGVPVVPLLHGGGQDRGVRSGTFAAGLIAACGAGLAAAEADRAALAARLEGFSDRMTQALTVLEGVTRTGPSATEHRLASHVHLLLEDVTSEALSLGLDSVGIAASGGAACGSGAAKPSHVLTAIGAHGTPLRLTTGWTTTAADIERAIDVLVDLLPRLRTSAAGVGGGLMNLAPVS